MHRKHPSVLFSWMHTRLAGRAGAPAPTPAPTALSHPCHSLPCSLTQHKLGWAEPKRNQRKREMLN